MKICFRHDKNLWSVGFKFKDVFLDILGGLVWLKGLWEQSWGFLRKHKFCLCAIALVCASDLHSALPDGLSYRFQTCFISPHNCVDNLLSINLWKYISHWVCFSGWTLTQWTWLKWCLQNVNNNYFSGLGLILGEIFFTFSFTFFHHNA